MSFEMINIELFYKILNNLPAHVFLKDAVDLKLVFVNTSFEKFNNAKPNSMVGKSDFDFFPSEQAKGFHDADREVLRNKKLIEIEEKIDTPNGTFWLRTKKVPILDDNGEPTHLLGIAEDITDRKRMNDILEKTQEEISKTKDLYESVLDNMPTNVVLKEGKNLSFTFVNKSFYQMNDIEYGSMNGKTDFDYFPKDQVVEFQKADRDVIQSGNLKLIPEEKLKTSKGMVWLRTKKIAIKDSKGVSSHILVLAEDITQEKITSDKLKTSLDDLRKARIDAENANQAKSTFLANMSHELRTPLNAIIGYSELLIEDAEDENQDFIPDLDKINSSGKHLLGLINDILDLSKVESGKMELFIEEYAPKNLLQEVESTIKPLIEKNKNKLKIELSLLDGIFKADVTKIRQIMFNLLSNASKFTENGNVFLNVRSDLDNIIFIVKDTGIGMTDEQVNKVFKPFTQAQEDTTRKFGGTGLGLTITKMFTEMMGGTINISSIYNEGTTFTVSIPKIVVDKNDKVVKKSNQTEIFEDFKYKVLVIDDDINSLDMMKKILSKHDYSVIQAKTGKDGLILAEKHLPDLITLDVIMPGMDGWEVLALLKENEKTKNIPVIMLTLVDDPDLGYSLGATDYLTKPVDWTQLSEILKKHQIFSDSHSILIVEDDQITSEMLKKNLEKNNYKVKTAKNGKQGLEIVKNSKPGLILLDLMMPEMDGFEFAEHLRENKDWIDIPVVVITAKDLSKEDHSRLKGNVEAIMQKGSYTKDELLSEVSENIKKIKVQNEKNSNS